MSETKKKLKLALVQPDIVWENIEANLNNYEKQLSQSNLTCDVLIFPEAFCSGFTMNAQKVSQPLFGKTTEWMRKWAQTKNIAICGSFFVKHNEFFYNRFVWVFPNGEVEYYDKRHLFSIEKENASYVCGKAQKLIEYKGWRIFPQICYDLRFPVWSRNTMNYDLMINVANWPASRREVWITLLKARAIENQCYVAAVNRVGSDENPIDYVGDSMIINYLGKTIHNAQNLSTILEGDICIDELKGFRKKFNTLIDADRFTLE